MPKHFSLERGLRAGLNRTQYHFEIGWNALTLSGEQQGPGSEHTQAGPTVCDLVRQCLHPVPDRRHLSVGSHRLDALLDEIGCLPKELARQGVLNGLVHQALLLVPCDRSLIYYRHEFGVRFLQTDTQDIGKQLVIAIPAPLLVKWDEEQVRLLHLFEQSSPVF